MLLSGLTVPRGVAHSNYLRESPTLDDERSSHLV